jgi:ABC-2 type transport system ATP-binding protein
MTVKADGAGARRVLEAVEGVRTVSEEAASAEEGTVTLKVTTASETDLRDEIFFAMAAERYAVISMERQEQSLEEIFLSLTAKGNPKKEVDD